MNVSGQSVADDGPEVELQGVWFLHSLEARGSAQSVDEFAGATLAVSGDRFEVTGLRVAYAGRIAACGSRLELQFTAGPERGNVRRALYKISRDGSWTVCVDTGGGPAPRGFSTGKQGIVTGVLRRDRPDAAAERVFSRGGEAIEAMQGIWTMVSCIRDGVPLPAAMVNQGRRTVRGVDAVVQFGPTMFESGKLYAVPGRPDAFDLWITDGGLCRGIFAVAGDRLSTCFGAAGAERPADFGSRRAEGRTLAEWQRAVR
jgi:uncharacterized protein (TIGR03067 family)